MFKDTLCRRFGRCIEFAGHAVRPDNHHLARLHVVHVGRADEIERAGLGSEHVTDAPVRQIDAAHRERPEPMRIARHDDAVFGQKHQRERALQLKQRIPQRSGQRALPRLRHQVKHHLGVAGGLEDRTFLFQLLAYLGRVGDVPVVGNRDLALAVCHRKWLRIQQHRIAGGRVARVANRQFTRQLVQHIRREDFGDVTHLPRAMNLAAIAAGYARAFLAAMLQGIEAQIAEIRRFGVSINRKNTALFMQLVEGVQVEISGNQVVGFRHYSTETVEWRRC